MSSYSNSSTLSQFTSHRENGELQYPSPSIQPGVVPLAQAAFSIHNDGQGGIQQQINGSLQGPGLEAKARLRKACDSCAARKVKCDEAGPPCRACAGLAIPCTYDRPSRRRGPPNRHADALKKRRVGTPGTPGISAPSSPTHAAHTLAAFAQRQVLSAEAILPMSVLQVMLDDYFTYIHPLVPIPHEPSFRAALERREDLINPTFLALLASMMGCLVASFPRRSRMHLNTHSTDNFLPNPTNLVDRCHKIVVEARGLDYLDRDFTVHDAVIGYLQGLAGVYTSNWQAAKVYFGQSLTILRILELHGVKVSGNTDSPRSPNMNPDGRDESFHRQGEDLILRELGRRTFWVLFVTIRSLQQLGSSHGEFWVPPATPSQPYPPLPLEIDDAYLTPTYVVSQPEGVVSMLAGFNVNVRIYSTYNTLSTLELAFGENEVFDWVRQKRVLDESLQATKQILEGIAHELDLNAKARFALKEEPPFQSATQLSSEDRSSGHNQVNGYEEALASRRRIQFGVQRANIYVGQLGTRMYLVEKYWNLYEAHPGRTLTDDPFVPEPKGSLASARQSNGDDILRLTKTFLTNELEEILKDAMDILCFISQADTEPNGVIFLHQVRHLASSLLDQPRPRKSAFALGAEETLYAFVTTLSRLERPILGGAREPREGEDEDEDEELVDAVWTDLRAIQSKMVAERRDENRGAG